MFLNLNNFKIVGFNSQNSLCAQELAEESWEL